MYIHISNKIVQAALKSNAPAPLAAEKRAVVAKTNATTTKKKNMTTSSNNKLATTTTTAVEPLRKRGDGSLRYVPTRSVKPLTVPKEFNLTATNKKTIARTSTTATVRSGGIQVRRAVV